MMGKDDVDFIDRLKTYVRSLAKNQPNHSSQNLKEQITSPEHMLAWLLTQKQSRKNFLVIYSEKQLRNLVSSEEQAKAYLEDLEYNGYIQLDIDEGFGTNMYCFSITLLDKSTKINNTMNTNEIRILIQNGEFDKAITSKCLLIFSLH
jgi:hypothetical protein